LNRSPRQIWGSLTLTAWFFSSLSALFPFSVCQHRLCLLLSHGTAQEACEKKWEKLPLYPRLLPWQPTNGQDIKTVIHRESLWATVFLSASLPSPPGALSSFVSLLLLIWCSSISSNLNGHRSQCPYPWIRPIGVLQRTFVVMVMIGLGTKTTYNHGLD